jgi:tetratricopeptide (TPR) repeat protein
MRKDCPLGYCARTVRLCLIAALILAPSASTCQVAAADDPDQPLSVVTLSSVDENLFALRFLADIYSQWPDLSGDRSKIKSWFSGSRTAIAVMRGKIHANHLDPDLDTAYSDCLDYMSSTEAYLDKLQLIQNQKDVKAVSDLASSLWGGYNVSNDVESNAKNVMSPENAADAGKLVGAADAASDFYNRSQQRDANAKAAILAEANRLEANWKSTEETLRDVARRMTAKHGWAPGEAGFDGFQSNEIADMIQRSPRDPFLQAKYGDEISGRAKSGVDVVPAINAYLTAARLVPADSTYDQIRYQFLQEAANSALQGASIDSGGSYSKLPASSFNAIKLARTYLSVDSTDSSGIGHVQLARALAFAGRYQEALSSAQTAYNTDHSWNTDPGYCIRYAKLMSFTNDQDQAVNWIGRAYQFGYNDVSRIRSDPDFSALRSQKSDDFQRLTTVKSNWYVKYNLMLDDVVIQNYSNFDLTHVKLQVHIRKGSQVWNVVAKCDYIQSGHSCTDESLFSIPDDSYDEGTASITSDQQ